MANEFIQTGINKLFGNSPWDVPATIKRGNAIPLDKTTLFPNIDTAKLYAKAEGNELSVESSDGSKTTYNPAMAYPGQFIAVANAETGDIRGYIVGGNKGSENNLIELGSVESTLNGMNVIVGNQEVPLAIVDNKLELSVGGGLKIENGVLTVAEISTISDISANATSNDPAATSAIVEYTKNYVAEKATVTIEQQATAETGYASTYVIKQGGVELGTKINIPKDFLVKSAELKECSEDGKPDSSLKKGDKYIDFVVNTVDDSETAQHIYLKVADLVDVYTGSEGSIVDIAVDGTTVKATVKANSIGFAQLCAEVKEYIDTQDAATYLSAKDYVDTVSAALSDDYVEKIGAAQTAAIAKAMEVSSAASAYTDAQIAAHDTAAKELLAQVSADAVTSALTDANKYTDDQIAEKIGDIDFSIYAISSDVSAELCAISSDLEGQIEQTLTAAKDYADELCGSISVTVDQKIADLNVSQYAISSDVKAELCAVSAETLLSATKDAEAKVAAEAEARAKAIEDLSTALSTDVKTLADDYAAVKADYAAVSADHDGRIEILEDHITSYANISGDFALSDDVKADIATAKEEAISSAKDYTDEAIRNIGTPLRFIGVYDSISDITSELKNGDVALIGTKEYVYVVEDGKAPRWEEIGDQDAHATVTALEAEKQAREAADAYLSGAIDNKLWYTNNAGNIVSADSLSVVKISQAEYHKLVNGENGGINDKAVYIVNSDGAYDMYGERVVNVAAPSISSDAANKKYVDDMIASSISVLNCGDAQSF